MSLQAVLEVLDELEEHICCDGKLVPEERVAIVLPDGDVGAADDARFVDWLLAHSEPAPFGHGKETKVDKNVRHAFRLKARGKAQIAGFDPKSVLDDIAAVLSPRRQLAATLTDVIVYPEDGKFTMHKDTPRSPELVGTLVVELPIARTGGAFHVGTGDAVQVFDWAAEDSKHLRWVALYSDVDHEVTPVTSGARVTIVYALHEIDQARVDPTWDARRAKLRAAFGKLASQDAWPVMIACTRQLIVERKEQPQAIETLRGADRDVADALVEAGFRVAVRACVVGTQSEVPAGQFPDTAELWSVLRLKTPLTPKVIAGLQDIVAFTEDASDDDGNDLSEYSIAQYILDDIQLEQWVIRQRAAATMIHEALLSDTGDFGNEAYEGYIYTLAALEITR